MMMNLFSSFDPSSYLFFTSNWFSMIIPIFLIPVLYWKIPSSINLTFKILLNYINKEISNNINLNNQKILILFSSIFWFIMINNIFGLYPYIFTASSHLTFTLSLALPLWLTTMIFGWINKTNNMFSHLVPNNTPMPLSSFMVLIETTSNIIRPITLSVRLAANMIAGHLLLTLLNNIAENSSYLFFIIMPLTITLLILEYAVALIQSYVFVTLLSLYINEVN